MWVCNCIVQCMAMKKRILIALVPASKELAQTSYFMATNSLHLTTMCLRYPPTIVACVCIHLACKWSKYEIPISGEVLHCYVDYP